MKFCPQLLSAMNFEYDGIIPCCTAFAQKVPLFPYGEKGRISRDAYKTFIRDVLADLNSAEPTLCLGCEYLEDVEAFPSLEPELRLLQLNKHRYICNCRCLYCEFWKTPKRSPGDMWPYVDSLMEQGMLHNDCRVDWGGGEPTILKEFEPLAGHIFEKGYRQVFFTNAVNYSDTIAAILQDGMGIVESSLDAASPEVFAAIKGKDFFAKVLTNITAYCAVNPKAVELKYIICNQNCQLSEIEGFLRICAELSVGKALLSLRLPIMKYTEARIYEAAAFFLEKGKELGLHCETQAIPPSHLAIVRKAQTHLVLDAPVSNMTDGMEDGFLFWGETNKADNPAFNIATQSDFHNALQEAEAFIPDASLRNWPGAFFFPLSPECDCSPEEFRRRAALVRLRPLESEEEFAQSLSLQEPELRRLFFSKLRKRHEECLTMQAEALSGKKVYFWGYDAPYVRHRQIFSGTVPQAILVNKDHDPSPPAEVDGIPVLFAQDVLRKGPVLPIVVFARDAYMKWVVFVIEEMNPAFGGTNLTLCRFFEDA